jgi:endonuclease III related protein
MKPSLTRIYNTLLKTYGPQHWWPGDTPFEISIGAILTQNVSWKNVEMAIKKLKENDILNPIPLHSTPNSIIAPLIKSTGYYNQKAIKINNFLDWFIKYNYSFGKLKRMETSALRKELLSVNGVGPETADSILLYAVVKKIFVIDAYTRRIFERLGFLAGKESYSEIQELFHEKFKGDIQDYNEYHALIVIHGKDVCRKKPLCEVCCLRRYCQFD